jgi:hypothetical protein
LTNTKTLSHYHTTAKVRNQNAHAGVVAALKKTRIKNDYAHLAKRCDAMPCTAHNYKRNKMSIEQLHHEWLEWVRPLMATTSKSDLAWMAYQAASNRAQRQDVQKQLKLPTYNQARAALKDSAKFGDIPTAMDLFISEYEPVEDTVWRRMLAAAISEYLPTGHDVTP